jgi:hypothetical protein
LFCVFLIVVVSVLFAVCCLLWQRLTLRELADKAIVRGNWFARGIFEDGRDSKVLIRAWKILDSCRAITAHLNTTVEMWAGFMGHDARRIGVWRVPDQVKAAPRSAITEWGKPGHHVYAHPTTWNAARLRASYSRTPEKRG